MKHLGILGENVDYSLSPVIQHHWIEKHAIDARYGKISTPPEKLAETMTRIRQEYRGCNVTIPYKQEVIPYLDHICDKVRAWGAINTVIVEKDGSLRGENTDVDGFLDPMERHMSDWHMSDWRTKIRRACVIGTGGAARAVIAGLQQEGVSAIRVITRSVAQNDKKNDKKAALTALAPQLQLYSWDQAAQALEGADLLVNATPCGMKGKPELAWDLGSMTKNACVYDLVYVPKMTGLLRQAVKQGLIHVGGLEMLIAQAARSFEMWFGLRPCDDAELRQKLTRS